MAPSRHWMLFFTLVFLTSAVLGAPISAQYYAPEELPGVQAEHTIQFSKRGGMNMDEVPHSPSHRQAASSAGPYTPNFDISGWTANQRRPFSSQTARLSESPSTPREGKEPYSPSQDTFKKAAAWNAYSPPSDVDLSAWRANQKRPFSMQTAKLSAGLPSPDPIAKSHSWPGSEGVVKESLYRPVPQGPRQPVEKPVPLNGYTLSSNGNVLGGKTNQARPPSMQPAKHLTTADQILNWHSWPESKGVERVSLSRPTPQGPRQPVKKPVPLNRYTPSSDGDASGGKINRPGAQPAREDGSQQDTFKPLQFPFKPGVYERPKESPKGPRTSSRPAGKTKIQDPHDILEPQEQKPPLPTRSYGPWSFGAAGKTLLPLGPKTGKQGQPVSQTPLPATPGQPVSQKPPAVPEKPGQQPILQTQTPPAAPAKPHGWFGKAWNKISPKTSKTTVPNTEPSSEGSHTPAPVPKPLFEPNRPANWGETERPSTPPTPPPKDSSRWSLGNTWKKMTGSSKTGKKLTKPKPR